MGQPSRELEGWDTVGRGLESNLTNPDLENYIQRAKMGTLPLPRPLKDWEPEKLNDRHITMLFLRAAGLPQKRISEIVGYEQATTSIVLNHPYSQFLLNKMLAYAAESVIDMDARIKALGPEMLDIAANIARDEEAKEAVRSNNAFKIIEMGGWGAKKESKVTHEIKMPGDKAELLSAAIAESKEIVDASWHFVDGEDAESGDSSDEPASVGKPPLNGSQQLLPSGEDK